MDLSDVTRVSDTMVYCPIFGKEIALGLCFDISNIGNDSLNLPPELVPPCGWDEAYRICKKCPEYY